MPIAMLMGLIMRFKQNSVMLASFVGLLLLVVGILSGHDLMQKDVLELGL